MNLRRIREDLRHFDWLLICVLCALILVGMLFVYSTGQRRFASLQARWLCIGVVAFAVVLWCHYVTLVKWSYAAYAFIVLLLGLVLKFGPLINWSRRWLVLGPFRVQPSEFMKLAFILALSKCLVERRDAHKRWSGLWRPIALTLVPMALIIRQPDLGMTCVFVPVLLGMLFAAGTPKRHLAAMVGVMMVAAVCAWP